jgi:ABC-type glycerol-3-phosphate transport system substrate-binding protein
MIASCHHGTHKIVFVLRLKRQSIPPRLHDFEQRRKIRHDHRAREAECERDGAVGLDVRETFPAADTMGPAYDQWTWDAFVVAAEKCFKAGVPFGLPISNCPDANAWIAALLACFGAELVDAKGNVVVQSNAVREALDYLKQLGRFLPPDVYTWNDASNNRALISGKSALIFNPPSAWASAVRDNPPVGAQIWHHPLPAGKHGRWLPWNPAFLGIWDFSPNKSAAKDLIAWLGERDQVEASLIASHGYDIPVFTGLTDFPIWAEAGPPKGTLFNFPLRPAHHAKAIAPGAPAPPLIAAAIYAQWVLPKLAGRVTQAGMSVENAIAETERDLAGIIAR